MIRENINEYLDIYIYEELDIIQIMFIELNLLPKLKLRNINKLKLEREIVKIVETKKNFNNNNIPFSMNLKYYGQKLNYKINSEGYINYINYKGKNLFGEIVSTNLDINGILFNKVKDISKLTIYLYTRNYKARYTDFIEEKNVRLRENLLIVEDKENNERNIEVFDITKIKGRIGKHKLLIKDISLNEDNSEFIRTIKDVTLHIKNDRVIKFIKDIKLPIITYKDLSLNNRNSNIGVLDIETYYDNEKDKSFTYSIGFKIFKGEIKMFYIKPNQTSDELILECINNLLVHAYHKYTFYVHNFNGYDSIFILKVLLNYNYKNNDYYKIDTIFRDNRIIKLTVSIKINKNTTRKITFVDSYLMLPASLDNLAKDFNCENKKGKFPYDFVNKNTLYYKGETPNKKYFKNMSDSEYKQIKSSE